MQQCHSIRSTAEQAGCSVEAVRRWWERHQATGKVHTVKNTGSKRVLSEAAEEAALNMLTSAEGSSAHEVSTRLREEGFVARTLHKTTIIRAARRAAKRRGAKLWVKRGKPPKAMTTTTKEKRMAFAQAHLNTNFSCWLFTDRKKFHFRYPGSKVQQSCWILGSANISNRAVYQPNHAQVLNMYAGASKFGMTDTHVVAGSSKHTHTHTNKKGQPAKNITSGQYKEVLKHTLLPGGKKLFSVHGLGSWTLQQDGDPTHKCDPAVVEQYNAENASSVMVVSKWPPNSPDLNLIENIWSWVQAEVDKMGCSSMEDFEAAVTAKLAAVPQQHLTHLWDSMPKRMQAVIEAGGGPTKY